MVDKKKIVKYAGTILLTSVIAYYGVSIDEQTTHQYNSCLLSKFMNSEDACKHRIEKILEEKDVEYAKYINENETYEFLRDKELEIVKGPAIVVLRSGDRKINHDWCEYTDLRCIKLDESGNVSRIYYIFDENYSKEDIRLV